MDTGTTLDSDINVTKFSVESDGSEGMSETIFDTSVSFNRIELCKADPVSYEQKDTVGYEVIPKTVKKTSPITPSRLLKCRLIVTVVLIISAMIVLYQIPVILFYTTINSQLADQFYISDYVDFRSCSATVSNSLLYNKYCIYLNTHCTSNGC